MSACLVKPVQALADGGQFDRRSGRVTPGLESLAQIFLGQVELREGVVNFAHPPEACWIRGAKLESLFQTLFGARIVVTQTISFPEVEQGLDLAWALALILLKELEGGVVLGSIPGPHCALIEGPAVAHARLHRRHNARHRLASTLLPPLDPRLALVFSLIFLPRRRHHRNLGASP